MKFKTIHNGLEPKIIVSYDNQNFEPQEYCGYSWCDGSCGLPALVLKHQDREFKTYSDMVACGPVFQPFRKKWIGKIEYIPKTAEDPNKLIRMMWW